MICLTIGADFSGRPPGWMGRTNMTDDLDPVEKVRLVPAAVGDFKMDGVPVERSKSNDQEVKVTCIRSPQLRFGMRANAILGNVLHTGDAKPLVNRNYGWIDHRLFTPHGMLAIRTQR